MALENFKPIEEIEYKISGPIKLTDENHEELMNRCLQMLNKFAPESATRSFFTERTGDEFVVLIEGTDSKTKETKIYGASGFKISTPLARNTITLHCSSASACLNVFLISVTKAALSALRFSGRLRVMYPTRLTTWYKTSLSDICLV